MTPVSRHDAEVLGLHLPPGVLSQAAWSTVFTIADDVPSRTEVDASAVTTATLLLLGVPESRAKALAGPSGHWARAWVPSTIASSSRSASSDPGSAV